MGLDHADSLSDLSVLYFLPPPRPTVRAMAAEGSIGACSPPSMGPVPWVIKLLAVPISPVLDFVLKHQDPQRLPQVEPWLGRRASDCVVSGEAAGPEVCGHCRTWTSSLEREQALTKSVFPEAASGPGGWECHRCACLSQGVCGECAVFTELNESAVSE